MEAAADPSIKFIGGTRGGFVFTDFFFATDAMYSVAKILEMMAIAGKRLGDFDRAIPHLATSKRAVNCSWEHKGKVMRRIMHDSERRRRDLIDGVKIYYDDGSSALLIPDKERPLFHINAEAQSKETADRLAGGFEKKVIAWRDEP
jgi:mannose-1-phosphate guanylyltransferase/phosphomannomutase